MSQNKEIGTNQIEEKEVQINRVLCYLDSQIPLKPEVLARFFTKKLSAPVISVSGRIDQRNFLKTIDNISAQDFFVFFIKIINIEQINELYGKWKKISAKKAKLLCILFDCSVPSFRGNADNLPTQRYSEMSQDQNTRIILFGRDKLDAEALSQTIDQMVKN